MIVQRQMSDARVRAEATVADATRAGRRRDARRLGRGDAAVPAAGRQRPLLHRPVHEDPARRRVRRRGRGHVHRLLRPLPGRGGVPGGPARDASASSPPGAKPRSTPIRSRCCAARRTASSRSRSSSSCCPTTARSCGASGAAPPAGRCGTRCAGCRSSPHIYDHAFDGFRADPEENPYEEVRDFVYHRAWTGPLYGALAFVVKAMCVDPEPELQEAYAALADAQLPARRRPRCSTTSRAVDYATVAGPLRAALQAAIRWKRRAGRSGSSPASARNTSA